jgi:hypothetical protein
LHGQIEKQGVQSMFHALADFIESVLGIPPDAKNKLLK